MVQLKKFKMLILLHPYKFTNFHYIQYELDIFENKLKDKFEIHDLSRIVNPTWNNAFKLKRHKKVKEFKSIRDWEKHFNNIKLKYKNIIVFNLLDINSFKSLLIQIKLKKFTKKLVQLDSPGHPNFSVEKKFEINLITLKKKIHTIINSPKNLYFFIKTKIFKIAAKFIHFNEIFILYHGSKKNFLSNFNAKKKIFVNYHSPDFSRMNFNIIKKNRKNKPIAIFLDAPGPHFQNDYDLIQNKIKYDKIKWYRDLNNFLKKIEKIYSCKVVIIPHPKVKKQKNPFYSKDLKISHDLEAVHKYIPKSKFVISIAASTAIGLACACNKPIILIYNDQLKKLNQGLYEETKFISKIYKTSLININNYKISQLIRPIDKRYNKKIIYKYMTSKRITDKKNYQIFNSII